MLNDSPIQMPTEDHYGFDPFAAALARCIVGTPGPEGLVLAINGPWGSGKSGVINLVLHHLEQEATTGRLHVLRFSPWWFTGAEALTRAFFEAFNTALGSALHGQAKARASKAVKALYQRLRIGKGVGAVGLDAATGTPVGSAVAAIADLRV